MRLCFIALLALTACVNRADLATQAAMQISPAVLPADGVSFATVAITIADATGANALPAGTSLFLISSDANAMITQFGPADANGWAYARIRSTSPGTQSLKVNAANASQSTAIPVSGTVTFNALAPTAPGPSARTSSLVANPNVVADDGAATSVLTLHVRDANGVPVPAVAVTFTSTGSQNFFSTSSGLTDINGILTTTLASTIAEAKVVTAHTSTMAVSTQVTFSPLGASSSFSTLQANPNTLPADGTSTTTLTFTVLDTAGLPLEGAPISWAVSGTNNNLVPGALVADANGMATATLSSTTAQTKTITASSGTMQVTQTVSFLTGPISTTHCTFVANPNLLTADNTSTAVLTFTARDAYGNAVANAPVSLSITGSNNNLSPLTGTTDGAGAFTATLTSGKAETKTVTAVSGTVTLNQFVTFLAGQPSLGNSTLTASPNTVTANGTSASTLTLTLTDALGNPVSGQAVTFTTTGTSTTFAQRIGASDATGHFTTTVTSTTAEQVAIIASFAGESVSTDVTFVNGAPSSSMTSVVASPTMVTANGTSTTTLTVMVLDAYGNAVPDQTVQLVSTGTNNTFNPSSGLTNAQGALTATLASTTAEVKTVTATAASATASAAVTFVAGSPSGTKTTFVANPTSLTADGTSQSTLTITVEDVNGNPVVNQAVSIASTGSNNTLSPASSGSTNGVGVFVAKLASSKAETKNLTATVGSLSLPATVTFVAGPPASATTTLTANPNTVNANGTSTTTLTVTVLDAFSNPVANQSVALSSTGSNNTFGSATGTTNASGVYSTTLASSTAQVKTVTATVGGSVTATATVTFKAGAPSSANCSLTANPIALTADGTSTTQLTLLVEDAFGNAVANQAVSLGSTGSNNTFTPASGSTNSAGQFVATLASTTAETKTITGTAGSATATTNVTFNPGAVSSLTTTLEANPNSVAADGSSFATLVTTALDAHGNPVPSQSVAMSASGGNNTFTPPSGSTNASGHFSSTLSSITVQTETISALVAGTLTANTNVTFTAPVISVGNSSIVASPNTLASDGTTTTTITVTVLNGNNAPVQGAPVTMSATGTFNVFSPVSGSTNTSGVFTTTLASTQAAMKTVTATVDGTALNTTVTFLPGAPVSTTTTLTASPNAVTADGVSTSTLTVVVKDINGNTVPSQTVSLTLSGGNNTLTPASGTTDATGTFTARLASTLAQTETVTATVNGFTETANVTFLPGTVSGVTTTFVASPNSTTADGVSAMTFTTTVRDSEGNPVPNQGVALSGTGSNNTFAPPSGSTNSAGVFTATMVSTMAQLKVVTATIGTVTKDANVVFVSGAPATGTSTLVLNPTSVTANGTTTTAITVTVDDAHGNPVANQNVTLSGSGTANVFTPAAGPTNANGVFSATLSSTVAQAENVIATVGSVNLTAAMTFTAGSPNGTTSTFVASPTTLVANGVSTSTLTVTLHDAEGNPVPSQAVSFSSSGTSNTLSPLSGSTNSAGVFTATFASTAAQVKVVTATIGGLTKTANVTFTAGSPNSTTTTFVASPTTLTADGSSTALLTVTVEDQYGNPVTNQGVTFSSTGSHNTFSPLSGTTNSVGVFTATLSSTTAEAKTVTATVGSLTPTAMVTFVAGAPASGTSSVAASPGMVTANGTSTTTVTVTVLDAQGNPVANQAVSLNANGTGNSWGATNGSTNASGVWSTTLASTVAQTETITATIGGVTETTAITFLAGAASGTTSAFSATPTSLTADGTSTTTLQVTLEDAQSNPVGAQAVTFSSTGTGYTFSALTCSTNTSGTCSVTLKSTMAEVVMVSAKFASVTETATVTFVPGTPSSTTSTLTASPTSLPDDGTSTSTLQITVQDAHNNAITGQAVTFSSTGSAYAFSSTTCTTNTSGTCAVTFSSTKEQTVTATATFAGASASATVTFVAGPAANTTSFLTASPNSLADDGIAASTLQVTVEDVTGNPVSGQAVTFASVPSTGTTFSAPTCTTAASGLCSVTLKSTVAQTVNVSATFAGATANASVTFLTGNANSTTSTLRANPNTLSVSTGSATTTLTVTVLDSTGNPVSGQAVSLAGSGTANTFSPVSGAGSTNGAGVFTATLSSTKAQVETITATIGTVQETATVTFTAGSPNGTLSSVTVNPNSVIANGTATTTVTVTAEDNFGNPVVTSVALNGTGSTNSFAAPNGTTSTLGVYTTTLSNTTAQSETITATLGGGAVVDANMTFTPSVPSLPQCTYVASPNTNVTANGVAASTLTVTVNSSSGSPISGQAVTFAAIASSYTLSPSTGVTNASGQFSTTITSTKAQTANTVVHFDGYTLQANVFFVAGPPAKLIFSTSPSTSSFGKCPLSPNAVVSVTDANGNLATTATNAITLVIGNNPNSATIGGTTTVSATAGVATFPGITLSKPGSGVTLTASATGLTSATSASFADTTYCASAATTTSVGLTGVTGLASGDFNDDGYLDVAVSIRSTKTIKIMHGNGTGTFGTFGTPFSFSVSATFYNVVAADFNGDHYTDLAMTDSAASSNAGVVYLNSKGATPFSGSGSSVALAGNANTITAMDVDGDGFIDLVAGGPSVISWVLNSGGSGTFGSENTISLANVWFPYVKGSNPDYGYVSGTTSLTGTFVGWGNTNSNPSASITSGEILVGSTYVFIVDQGGGNYFESARRSTGVSSGVNGLNVVPNDYYVAMSPGMTTSADAAAVFSNDSGLEIITIDTGANTIDDNTYSTGHKTIWVTTGDFNNDGIADAVTANYDNNSVTCVLMGGPQ